MNCVSESPGEIPECVEGWPRRKANTPTCPDNSMVTVIQGMKLGEDGENRT
ncbi:hypothetical protein [Desulfoscipio geothermicus]|uniref:hypothetical protein n=1 Tax=Desulfoscipio geothermicus TaxID=39060 RepID=UPI0013F4F26C|nr:hypothetical protein [Desulfoscipio geothermicus]